MSPRVIVFRRCGCIDPATARQLGRRCPQLRDVGHGGWYYAVQLPTVGGRRSRHRQGRFDSAEQARAAGQALLDADPGDAAAQVWTVGRWLEHWLATVQLRPSTVNYYRQHVCPTSSRCWAACAWMRSPCPGLMPGILYFGPPKSRASNRTIALDPECLARIRGQLACQGDDVRQHRYVGQNRSDNRTRVGTVEHDTDDDDAMFTYADGRPIRPEYLSHRFRTLIGKLGLPPTRLHDLRHCAASLALAANTDLKVIQQMLGHSSIVTTADTYTSVLPEVAHEAAQASADMILNVAR